MKDRMWASVLKTRRTVLCAVLFVVGLAVLPAGAQADPPVHTYKSAGTMAPSQFPGTSRLAVEPGTGNILVLNGSTITVFAPDQTTQLTSIPVTGSLAGLATDPGNGAVYYADGGAGTITRYISDGAPTPTYTADASFTGPTQGSGAGQVASIAGVAVDPTTHDVLVADPGNDRVSRYDANGAFVSSFSAPTSPSGGFAGANDIAVGPTGEIYVVAAGHVDRFTAAGVDDGELTPAGSPSFVAVEQTTGRVLVIGDGGFAANPNLSLFDATGAFQSVVALDGAGYAVGGNPGGLAVDSSQMRAYANSFDFVSGTTPSKIEVFDAAVRPGADLTAVNAVGVSSVHLEGTVDSGENGTLPAGRVEGNARFVLTAPGLPTVQTPDQAYTATAGNQPIVADATGLVPNTTYTAKLVASNILLTGESAPQTFTTSVSAPAAETRVATDITDTSAVVHGAVTAFGLQTTYVFEYGPTTSYGSKVPAGAPGVFGISYTARAVERTLEGLKPGVTYHYRVVATNSVGTTAGADATFTTSTPESARGYEMVTPTEKGGGAVDPAFGFQARADGDAIIFKPGSPFANINPESSVQVARYMVNRQSDGWAMPHPVDPPTDTHRLDVMFQNTFAVSDDFSHAFVLSTRKLTPDSLDVAGTGGANLYVRDTQTGSYRFVAGSTDTLMSYFFTALGNEGRYWGGNKDFSSVVFESPVALTSDALPGYQLGVYRWSSTSGLELISRLPDGTPAAGVTGRPTNDQVRWVSADARRVVFASGAGSADDAVYLWENGDTRALSVSHRPVDPSTPRPAGVTSISRDGRYVTMTITSADPLTNDAPAAGGNIYSLDLDGAPGGSLSFVAANAGVTGVSEDGSHVYLDGTPDPSGPAGRYVWSSAGLRYISATPSLQPWMVNISPNGNYAVFASGDRLTSYDNQSHNELYLYDAVRDQFSCASCPQDGSPSTGEAQSLEPQIPVSNRYPRQVVDNGTVFFHTPTALVAGDVNGRSDVYSFRNGRATLISPGKGPYTARFMDASDDGRNVFFVTPEALSSRDLDEEYDVYDARVGGGDPTPAPRVACGGDECADPKGAPTGSSAPATETGSGRQMTPKPVAKAKISKVKSVLTKTALRVTVRVNGRGRLRATGSRVRTTVRQGTAAGTYTISVPLGNTARSALRHHRRMKLAVRVTFTPPFGTAAKTTFTRTLGK